MQREMHRTTGWKVQGTQCLHLGRTTLPALPGKRERERAMEENKPSTWGTSSIRHIRTHAGPLIQPHLFYRMCVVTVTTYISVMLHTSLAASAGHCCLVCWPWAPVSSLSLPRGHRKVHKERFSPELSVTSLTT